MSAGIAGVAKRRTAGDKWRVQGDRVADTSRLGPFDEIVVGHQGEEGWLHVEMLDYNSAFVQVADRCFWVYAPRKHAPQITWEETRPWRPWRQCRKRPGGKRCSMRAGHNSECVKP